jgi:hypothetical protein
VAVLESDSDQGSIPCASITTVPDGPD